MASCKITSIKSLKYKLTVRVGAELTTAKLYHYRWLREYIEGKFDLHYGGQTENPVNYAEAVVNQFCDTLANSQAKRKEVLKAFADWKTTEISLALQKAKDTANKAKQRIAVLDETTDIGALESFIESIGSIVPMKWGGCKHCQC